MLGSAIVVLDVDDDGQTLRLAFTGDLGRHHLPILRDPEVPGGVECLVTESTYGDRLHGPIELLGEELAAVIRRTHERGGKVVIPSFALERAQEVVYELKRLREQHRIPALPVYVDSPLTVKLTDIFRMHPECYDDEARALLRGQDSPFEFDGLKYVSDVEESKAIDVEERPSIIIAASGMCEAGRVLHHLRTTIADSRNTVAIVGFQAQHTLGRRLVERRPEVRIFGVMRPRRAEVVVLDGFSAHADQKGLLDFAEAVRDRGPLRRVLLVHGEPRAQEVLTRELEARGFPSVHAPAPGERRAALTRPRAARNDCGPQTTPAPNVRNGSDRASRIGGRPGWHVLRTSEGHGPETRLILASVAAVTIAAGPARADDPTPESIPHLGDGEHFTIDPVVDGVLIAGGVGFTELLGLVLSTGEIQPVPPGD